MCYKTKYKANELVLSKGKVWVLINIEEEEKGKEKKKKKKEADLLP